MPRRRKTRQNNFNTSNESEADEIRVNYTIDEDSENPFVPRRRLGASPPIQQIPVDLVQQNLEESVGQNFEHSAHSVTFNMMENNNNALTGPAGSAGNVNNPENQPQNLLEADNITQMLERVLINSQAAFIREISSLKTSLLEQMNSLRPQMAQNNNFQTPQNMPNLSQNVQQNTSTVSARSNNSNFNSRDPKVPLLYKWNISYDGTENVHDFLFKVKTLQKRYDYPLEQVIASFHVLVKGKAETWFWFYLRQKPNTTFAQLEKALIKEFGKLENDCDKIIRMLERRQQPKESFDDFYTVLVTMNSRLDTPMDDDKLIELIKNNSKEALGNLLFGTENFNLDHLRDSARKAEKYLLRQQSNKIQTAVKPKVGELEFSDQIEDQEQDLDVSALNFNDKRNKRVIDTSKFKCWNCDQTGHSFYECPSDKRSLFCFRCGEKNVTTPKCPKKHSEN